MRAAFLNAKTPPFSLDKALVGLRYVPAWLQRRGLALGVAKALADKRGSGELDFLQGRWVAIQVRDLGYDWRISLQGQQFRVEGPWQAAEAVVRADFRDFLAMLAQRVDPDTLFFQRRLEMEGDTELSLAVKNLLDSVDPEKLPAPLRKGIAQAADWLSAA